MGIINKIIIVGGTGSTSSQSPEGSIISALYHKL
jgi:hypothetical protein